MIAFARLLFIAFGHFRFNVGGLGLFADQQAVINIFDVHGRFAFEKIQRAGFQLHFLRVQAGDGQEQRGSEDEVQFNFLHSYFNER